MIRSQADWSPIFRVPGGMSPGIRCTRAISAKRLQVFAEAMPGMRRVGILFNERYGPRPRALLETEAAAEALKLELVTLPTGFPNGVQSAFARARRENIQGVVILSDPATISQRGDLGSAAIDARLPTMFANKQYLEGRGLMSYGPDILQAFRRAASYTDRILKGAKPGELAVEQPARFELAVNLATAKLIGITIPA
ncbi:MAG TPA: ABC transporter substrate-binding protein [Casimicrobiaceae bacterium]|nr:ABC transporter substrate-binding protein [Casimicrobiaceae bacterium]